MVQYAEGREAFVSKPEAVLQQKRPVVRWRVSEVVAVDRRSAAGWGFGLGLPLMLEDSR